MDNLDKIENMFREGNEFNASKEYDDNIERQQELLEKRALDEERWLNNSFISIFKGIKIQKNNSIGKINESAKNKLRNNKAFFDYQNIDRIDLFIQMLEEGNILIYSNHNTESFKGTAIPVGRFWQLNKNAIKDELFNNPKYESYFSAKESVKNHEQLNAVKYTPEEETLKEDIKQDTSHAEYPLTKVSEDTMLMTLPTELLPMVKEEQEIIKKEDKGRTRTLKPNAGSIVTAILVSAVTLSVGVAAAIYFIK